MSELKSPNFGALVIEALNNCGQSRYQVFRKILGPNSNPNKEHYSDTVLLNRERRASFCIRICEVLNINAKTAYNKYLQDKGLADYDDKILIQLAPQEWLSKYQFMSLHIKQMLRDIETLEKLSAGRSAILNKIVECRCIKDKQAEMQAILDNTQGLKPEMREVLKLRFFEGLTAGQTADVLGCYQTQVYHRTQNGLKIFAKNALKSEAVI